MVSQLFVVQGRECLIYPLRVLELDRIQFCNYSDLSLIIVFYFTQMHSSIIYYIFDCRLMYLVDTY